ncbi:MAG: aldehyde dehydrogenase family protein [Bacteroidetes bacterium]|nr:aldehyde dehydrogenase family protein [Bacteroidota bacterium]
MTVSPLANTPSEKVVDECLAIMREAQQNPAYNTFQNRRDRIDRILKMTLKYRSEIQEALQADFKKPSAETDLSEILTITSEAKYIKKHLKRWMRAEKVATPISMVGTPSYIHYEPKGVVLIIAPWNFPYQLLIGPLMSALAAGNCAVLKPSEMTPHTSALLSRIIPEYFSKEEVQLFEGGVETAQLLLSKKFNHIFFTGSPGVGKIVMEAAAKNLASVTLELGGKSPVIVDRSANIKQAAQRILWAKCMNAGQICIAPDYAWVHEEVKEAFLDALRDKAESFFGESPQKSPYYARLIHEKAFQRIKGYLDEAQKLGARIEMGGQTDPRENYIAPTVLTKVSLESGLMQEEIFGPVLPVLTFKDLEDPIRHIQAGEKPLSMYIFGRNKKRMQRLIDETRAGGTVINNCLVQFFNHHLPFGGSNNSGIGKAHGIWGFKAFSNARGICKQVLPSAADLLATPYTPKKQRLIDWVIKWL